ncbi:GmrSD restriction endonuclease domain-containing protein [Nocardia sp. N13]|uniref:GmrSD restriction endonuclease domain-containing protein n=1 Tax=Nocardioides sp. N13(2025) TaxID=3453405 RepID=UPI003F769407
METKVRTPHEVFFMPQRLLVPLFQRPYVWTREKQWSMLWEDIRRHADLRRQGRKSSPHFLGAVVLQNQSASVGNLPYWTIIDGQQRLTTMQLLLDAAHQALTLVGADTLARQVEDLIRNPEHFCGSSEDRFKVWPTNRDRAAFNDVMAAALPVDYTILPHRDSRMTQGHQFFSEAMTDWLATGAYESRAEALTHVLLNGLQLVVIQLEADEDSQEIFETLNARGTPLTAADLIKNFVFQRLDLPAAESEASYEKHWKLFETAFWENEVGAGRNAMARSSLFLNQWLIAQTAENIGVREVFSRFKYFVTHDLDAAVGDLLPAIHRAAIDYQSWTETARVKDGVLDRLTLFVYRIGALDSEATKPLLIWLRDPALEPVAADVENRFLTHLESWLVRRSLLRLSTQSYSDLVALLLQELKENPRQDAATVTERVLREQTSGNLYWPADEEVRTWLATAPIYRRLRRGRLRMVLEAIEDHLRGYDSDRPSYAGQRVARDHHAIEHILPQQWQTHWPVDDVASRLTRDNHVHVLGNLTLLTRGLNSKVSNGPWLGETGKRAYIAQHDVMLMNNDVRAVSADGWDEQKIDERTEHMTRAILEIWSTPAGHAGIHSGIATQPSSYIGVDALISEGLLKVGQTLIGRGRTSDVQASVLPDGSLQVEDRIFESPSGAARFVKKRKINGWTFWAVDAANGIRLDDLRSQYSLQFGVDVANDDDQESEVAE